MAVRSRVLTRLRRIVVGPDSAGADPGPACYARGGNQPTVTDADVVLGRIDLTRFAGGKIALDPARALKAVTEAIAAPLSMPVQEAARGIAEIVDETMASAARVHAVENGKETSGRTLIAFGGAAPLHAVRLAQKLGIRRVVVPPDAGVGSALGFLGAPIAYEVVRTLLVRLDALEQTTIDALFADMRAEAEAVVRLGVPQGSVGRNAYRVHALSRPGSRGCGAAARRHAGSRRPACGVRRDVCPRLWPRHSTAGSRGRDLDAVACGTA